MKLIKINTDHYIIVDDSEKMTHSTNVFDEHNLDLQQISLQEVKELIGEVDVEESAQEYAIKSHSPNREARRKGYIDGYNQALEDNKEKKYTEEDLRKAMQMYKGEFTKGIVYSQEQIIQSLQPKTEWEVEIVDGKLKLI